MATDSAVQNGVFSIPLASAHPIRPFADGSGSRPLPEFVGGPENDLLPVAVEAVFAGNFDYSPLCLAGPTGVGKSHLITGLVARWNTSSAPSPGGGLLYAGADFVRMVTDACQTDCLTELRQKILRAPLFVLDNLEELAGHWRAQQEYCGLLDAFALREAVVVATAKSPPLDVHGLTLALGSRLSHGLCVSVRPPDLAVRRILLSRLAEHWNIELSPHEIEQLAAGSPDATGCDLQSLLLRYQLFLTTSPQGEKPTRTRSEDRVSQFLDQQQTKGPTIKEIAARTAKLLNVTQRDLCGPTRRQAVVRARGVAMYVARQVTGESLEAIGKHFGNRDHTTVLHACRRTKSLLETDPIVAEAADQLMKDCT